MLGFLPPVVRGVVAFLLLVINTLFWCALLFVCALVMLCVTQLSAVRLAPVDVGVKAGMADVVAVTSVDAAGAYGVHSAAGAPDIGGTDEVPGSPTSPASLADLSSELAEPLAPVPALLWPAVRPIQPAAPLRVALPHPLIEGPQRPPRSLQA